MSEFEISVSDVGGIKNQELSLSTGCSIISGTNATNKTSLLKAISFGMGAEGVPIRSGATEAEVTLTVNGSSTTRAARRRGTGLEVSGEPWLRTDEARKKFETAAALLEFNPLRSAVRQGKNVEDALKGPVDFDELERERSALLEEKRSLEREVERLDDVEGKLERQEAKLADAESRRAELNEKLDELQSEYDPERQNERVVELRERRTDLLNEKEETEERIESTRDAIERLENRREELADEASELEAELDDTGVSEMRAKKEQLEAELDEIRDQLDILQSVFTANREMVSSDYTGVLGREHGVISDEVTCWTCSQSAAVSDIEDTIERLKQHVQETKGRRREHEPEIENLEDEISARRKRENELNELQAKRREVTEELETKRNSMSTHEERLDEIESELSTVDDELEMEKESQSAEKSDTADAIEETRVNIKTTEREIERLEQECEKLRDDLDRLAAKTERLDGLGDEIKEFTDHIEGMEQQLREQFNEAMDDLLDEMEFENIERVWLDGEFELIVARDIDGTVHQDSVRNLAESERELIGLVLGLAGYLAYDLADGVPVLLIDSLGALDNERVSRLLNYFKDRAEFVVAAVHPTVSESFDSEQVTVAKFPSSA